MGLTKTFTIGVLFFTIFVISGYLTNKVFLYTGCIWTSSVFFGVSVLSSLVAILFICCWDIVTTLIPWPFG